MHRRGRVLVPNNSVELQSLTNVPNRFLGRVGNLDVVAWRSKRLRVFPFCYQLADVQLVCAQFLIEGNLKNVVLASKRRWYFGLQNPISL